MYALLMQEELVGVYYEMLVRVIDRSSIATTLLCSECSVVGTWKPPLLVPLARLPAGVPISLTRVGTFKNSSE